ncbi:hypothetical protein MUK42_30712 [Musa troglodytarum]|uniref:Uncharacterized protein n=1 Tax=Musa troglodytarum TaxID=320322 RepID=A0A9E7G0T1_9LILI|nr:hypothetical protein MUK42_30712 [Musa troglodytarum]
MTGSVMVFFDGNNRFLERCSSPFGGIMSVLSSDDLVSRMDHSFIDGEAHLVGDTHQQIGLPVEKESAGDSTTIFNCDHAPEPLSVKAVALIIEEMGCKPPHVATDKTDIDQLSFLRHGENALEYMFDPFVWMEVLLRRIPLLLSQATSSEVLHGRSLFNVN